MIIYCTYFHLGYKFVSSMLPKIRYIFAQKIRYIFAQKEKNSLRLIYTEEVKFLGVEINEGLYYTGIHFI